MKHTKIILEECEALEREMSAQMDRFTKEGRYGQNGDRVFLNDYRDLNELRKMINKFKLKLKNEEQNK